MTACASAPPPPPPPEVIAAPEPAPIIEPIACEPEIDLATEAAVRKLKLANEWHKELRYESAFEAYEAVLAEHASLLSDAYALWGIISIRLDRDNPGYSSDGALTAIDVLDQSTQLAIVCHASNESRVVWLSAQIRIKADVRK